MKGSLKQLNYVEFKGAAKKLREVRGELTDLQTQLRDLTHPLDIFTREKELKQANAMVQPC